MKDVFSNMTLEQVYDGRYDIDSFKSYFVSRWQAINGSSENAKKRASLVFHSLIVNSFKKQRHSRI